MSSDTTNPPPPVRNIRLRLAYDGTTFAGWQVQPQLPTIQGCLEAALLKTTGESIRVLSAGRTDAGVHALGQVANFTTAFPIPPAKWRPALQSLLPEGITILQSEEVPGDFHSTFSATSKRYRYVIYNSLVGNPFISRYSWRITQELDVAAMQAAAECLVGRHDFRSFESDWPNKASSVRTVMDLQIFRAGGCELFAPRSIAPLRQHADARSQHPDTQRSDDAPTQFICLEIEADGFLYNMVRAITGTLVYVGRGAWTNTDIARALAAQDRAVAGATAPACGLFMVHVNYPV